MLHIGNIVICVTSICLPLCSLDTLKDVENLYDYLFVNSRYNINIRGISDQTQPIRVGANFALMAVVDVNEREEAIEVNGCLNLSWKDERLAWDPEDNNGTSETPKNVKSDIFKAMCHINVVSFPWDRQLCSLTFTASGHLPKELLLEADKDVVDMHPYNENESWRLLTTSVKSSTDFTSRVQFWICLERRPNFHVAVDFLPTVILSVLNLFALFVKVDSGERISFSITILLSLTLYLTLAADQLPTHSNGMAAIIYCLRFVLVESAMICLVSIVSLNVYHKKGVPPYTCQVVVAKVRGRKKYLVSVDKDITQGTTEENTKEVPGTRVHRKDDIGVTWMDVSWLVDRVCFCLALVALIAVLFTVALYVVFQKVNCTL